MAKKVFERAAANAPKERPCKDVTKIGDCVDRKLENVQEVIEGPFSEGVDKILGSSPKRLRDAEFITLTQWCELNNRPEYAKHPRTFAVLQWIGCPEAIQGFVHESLSDIALPYTDENLPRAVRGSRARSQFLDYQQYVLTDRAEDLETPGRQHLNIPWSANDYFHWVGVLGRGGFGQVSHVVGRLSLQHFALKRIPYGRSFNRDKNAIRSFENELKALKDLSHPHLVKLISSYTDKDYVGLVMTPVADMNLATYLSATAVDPVDRKNCIREFYGCLGTAVEYLHKQQIRHEDIKPENVLVLRGEGRVLMTDFGTSHHWADDTKCTTSGPMREGFTERYCAPEVASQTRRNESSDIWSLGCIFIEMSTVLSSLTISDMRKFFQNNGNQGQYFCDNRVAFEAWCREIAQNIDLAGDLQALELGKRMCAMDRAERPAATEIVSEILDFKGPASYYCYCCERDTAKDSTTMTKPQDNHHKLSDSRASPESSKVEGSVDGTIPSCSSVEWSRHCQWPSCSQPLPSTTDHPSAANLLQRHYRLIHGCHDFGLCGLITSSDTLSDPTISSLPRSQMLEAQLVVSCAETNPEVDPYVEHVRRIRAERRKNNQADPVLLSECTEKAHTAPAAKGSESYAVDKPIPPEDQKLPPKTPAPENEKNVRFTMPLESPGQQEDTKPSLETPLPGIEGVRFGMLPENLRPAPIDHVSERRHNISEQSMEEREIVEPIIESTWPFLNRPIPGRPDTESAGRVPESSLVPSYHLASTNRFSPREISALHSTSLWGSPSPLFVYGSLMFPSVLTACAEFFISEEGVYSSRLQRRLRTDRRDWNSTNVSLQHAAEQMTPACVAGFARWKPKKRSCAALQASSHSHVHGFLIFGLAKEALCCLDAWHNEGLGPSSKDYRFSRRSAAPMSFCRRVVRAEIRTNDGERKIVEATTYTWNGKPSDLRSPWDVNDFVRSRAFTRLSRGKDESKRDGEEEAIARKMGIEFIMRGDALCGAALRQDKERLLDLLGHGYDVDAPCRVFGTALQAASRKGAEEIVHLLIEEGADVNAKGGRYGNAVTAATFKGNGNIVRALLKKGANVLDHSGEFINPLYQAVDFSDVGLAHLLLEKGAWLTQDYHEILDLAAEIGSPDMIRMLEDYDVRMLHRKSEGPSSNRRLPESSHTNDGSDDGIWYPRQYGSVSSITDNRRAVKPMSVVRAVAVQALMLKGQRGKWTGIKAVRLLKTAIQCGISESIIDQVTPFLSSYQKLVDFLGRASQQMREEQQLQQQIDSPGTASGSSQHHPEIQSPSNLCTSRAESTPNYAPETDVFCLTCNGGGRNRTARTCNKCAGAGYSWERRGTHSSRTPCERCLGRGHIFSERDICCHGGIGTSRITEVADEDDDPPPPYTPRADTDDS